MILRDEIAAKITAIQAAADSEKLAIQTEADKKKTVLQAYLTANSQFLNLETDVLIRQVDKLRNALREAP